MSSPYLVDGPDSASQTIILAHGAGVGMYHPSMEHFATGLAAAGLRVVRFEFPYMRRKRLSGQGGGPDPPAVLINTWKTAIADAGDPGNLVIGGRSMGGRVASMVADEAGVAGLVCLAYPFHPAGRPERVRTEHLAELRTPTLIIQGTRDALGLPGEIETYDLSSMISTHFIEDGDHSFQPRKSSGRTGGQNMDEALAVMIDFVRSVHRGT